MFLIKMKQFIIDIFNKYSFQMILPNYPVT